MDLSDDKRTSGDIGEGYKEVKGNILVIASQGGTKSMIHNILKRNSYRHAFAISSWEANNILSRENINIVLMDMMTPGLEPRELLNEIKRADKNIPVVLLTPEAGMGDAQELVRDGAYDYITRPFNLTDFFLTLDRAGERINLLARLDEHKSELEREVTKRTRQLLEVMMDLEKSFSKERKAHLESILVLSKAAEINDYHTGNHIKRVSRYSASIASHLNLSGDFVEKITYSSPMHDIGKISVDPYILNKPGKLTPQEFDVVKQHTVKGAEILGNIPFLKMAREIALHHHEKFNSKGYPYGLRGHKIPLAAMIVSVSDMFDALISKRCYKLPIPIEAAREIIEDEAGISFDPEVVKAFLRVSHEIRDIVEELKDPDI